MIKEGGQEMLVDADGTRLHMAEDLYGQHFLNNLHNNTTSAWVKTCP